RRAAEAVRLARQDGGRQGGLAVVDVADGADVDVRLGPRELLFGHGSSACLLVLWGERSTGGEHRVQPFASGRFLAGPDTPPWPHVRPDGRALRLSVFLPGKSVVLDSVAGTPGTDPVGRQSPREVRYCLGCPGYRGGP